MNVRRFINSPVSSNSYLVSNEGFKECVIVDPGSKDVTELISFLDENELRLIGIILTHEHFDHVWGANVLRGRYNAQIACSKRCLQKISIPQNYFNLLYYNDSSSFQIDSVDIITDYTSHVNWVGLNFNFINTPGHSSSSICISVNNALFTGDTVMKGFQPILKKRHEASIEELRNSVNLIFCLFPLDTTVYPGHGDSFLLGEVEEFYKSV